MAQSIKSLKKSVRNLQRKIDREKRRQEIIVSLERDLICMAQELGELKANGTPEKLYVLARKGLVNSD